MITSSKISSNFIKLYLKRLNTTPLASPLQIVTQSFPYKSLSTLKSAQTEAFLQIIPLPSYKHVLPIPYPDHPHRINLISAE